MLFPTLIFPLLGAAGLAEAVASYVREYNTWKLHDLECFTDGRDDGIRTLRDMGQNVDNDAMTVEMCLDSCEASGYSLGGVEYGRECWCGNTVRGTNYGEDYYPPYTKGRCSFECTGNSSQICGGSGAINLYVRDNATYTYGLTQAIVPGFGMYSNSFTYCWDDYGPVRTLKHTPSTPLDPTRMTVQGCLNACAADYWTSAGVEYGRECYCDNRTYPIGESTVPGDCMMPCDGDASQYCGGSNHILVYNHEFVHVHSGRIGVDYNNGVTTVRQGYLSKYLDNGRFHFTTIAGDSAIFTFSHDNIQEYVNYVRISLANVATDYPYLGLVLNNATANLQSLSTAFTFFSAVNGTSPQSLPTAVGSAVGDALGTSLPSESDLWALSLPDDALSAPITPIWRNVDGSYPIGQLVAENQLLYFVGDKLRFDSLYAGNALPVSLVFVTDSLT